MTNEEILKLKPGVLLKTSVPHGMYFPFVSQVDNRYYFMPTKSVPNTKQLYNNTICLFINWKHANGLFLAYCFVKGTFGYIPVRYLELAKKETKGRKKQL